MVGTRGLTPRILAGLTGQDSEQTGALPELMNDSNRTEKRLDTGECGPLDLDSSVAYRVVLDDPLAEVLAMGDLNFGTDREVLLDDADFLVEIRQPDSGSQS